MRLCHYATPHLFGTIHYPPGERLRPDGDTLHLRDPVLLFGGKRFRAEGGRIEISLPGHTRPRALELRGDPPGYLTIRLSGIDAPESHYIASVRPEPSLPPYEMRPQRHRIVCQPHASAPLKYLLRALAQSHGHALIEIDRDLTDNHGRVLGYAYASDPTAGKHTFLSLELVRRGLAFPFVFESAGDHRKRLLRAGARARRDRLGVWRHYVDKPLPYERAAFPYGALREGDLNLPVVFRRVVECAQLRGLRLEQALRKYDVFDDETGELVPGDAYRRVPVERRVWAPHRALELPPFR